MFHVIKSQDLLNLGMTNDIQEKKLTRQKLIHAVWNFWFPGGTVVKNPFASAGETGDVSLIPRMGRSPGAETGYPLQYSCLENSVNRGVWWATVHEVSKNWSMHTHLEFKILCHKTLNYMVNEKIWEKEIITHMINKTLTILSYKNSSKISTKISS